MSRPRAPEDCPPPVKWATPRRPAGWLLGALLLVGGSAAVGFPAVVSETNLRTVILGQAHSFTTTELQDMDLNGDNVVDVADLIFFKRDELTPKLAVTFAEATTTVPEHAGQVVVPVAVDPSYSGRVCFLLSGTAGGADYTSTAPTCSNSQTANARQFTVSGGVAAALAFNISDDALIPGGAVAGDEGLESITITLVPEEGYQLTIAQQHTIYITDNDEVWHGVWEVGNLLMDFRLELARVGDSFVPGGNVLGDESPALGAPPGRSAVDVVSSTASELELELGPFTVAAADTLLGAALERSITLRSDTTAGDTLDYDVAIDGAVEETVTATGGDTQFERAPSPSNGRFRLIKGPATAPVPDSGLVTLP